LNYKVADIQLGQYDCDTLFIEVDKNIVQIPISKKAKATKDLIGKSISVDKLDTAPLEKIIVATVVNK
jgi:hypothetical protein